MIQEKFYVLAFDNKDTKKIVEYFKNKKNLNKFLAITPNAFEILKKNKFKYIFTPFDINKDLHKDLALDNIEFRDKIIQNSNKNINNIFLNESFKNILIQSFSTLNFFNKILKLENYYYTYLNNKFELIPNKELYNNIVKKIILENYGIFKVNKKNSNQNFYLKKLINNFLFFFLKKKKIIFNFLNNNKKLSNSPNTIEITFGSLSNSTLVNYYLFGYNFLQFFFKKKIKKIFPDINYKIDLNLRDKIEEFINKLKIDLFTDIDKAFFNFICENVQYENELEKFLYKRFDKLHVKYLFADHLTWKDPYCVSKFLYKKKNRGIFMFSWNDRY